MRTGGLGSFISTPNVGRDEGSDEYQTAICLTCIGSRLALTDASDQASAFSILRSRSSAWAMSRVNASRASLAVVQL
jgi:hypothetical protein